MIGRLTALLGDVRGLSKPFSSPMRYGSCRDVKRCYGGGRDARLTSRTSGRRGEVALSIPRVGPLARGPAPEAVAANAGLA